MTRTRSSLGLVGMAVLILTSPVGCSSGSGESQSNPTPSTTPTKQIVTVTATATQCVTSAALVHAGQVVIRATATGIVDVSVIVYGPKDGRFIKPLGRITSVNPGTTKSMVVNLDLGAYEISCKSVNRDDRSRLTAV